MSKLLLFDFKCPVGHEFEELVPANRKNIKCTQCDKTATRQISGTHLDPRMGLTNDFPSMARKWEKKTRQRATTDKVDGPNLWMY